MTIADAYWELAAVVALEALVLEEDADDLAGKPALLRRAMKGSVRRLRDAVHAREKLDLEGGLTAAQVRQAHKTLDALRGYLSVGALSSAVDMAQRLRNQLNGEPYGD